MSRQRLEGAAHHGGARHFAEGADMRQARGAIAGLEQHFRLARAASPASSSLRASSKGQALLSMRRREGRGRQSSEGAFEVGDDRASLGTCAPALGQ